MSSNQFVAQDHTDGVIEYNRPGDKQKVDRVPPPIKKERRRHQPCDGQPVTPQPACFIKDKEGNRQEKKDK